MPELPNALDMLKLPEDAFMLEVSRAVSEKPWPHREEFDGRDTMFVCANDCGAEKHGPALGWIGDDGFAMPSCSVPPRLDNSIEWWAFKLRNEFVITTTEERFATIKTVMWHHLGGVGKYHMGAERWFSDFAQPTEWIAVCLVALGHWRIEP